MKIKNGYILKEVAGRYFAVALGDVNENKMITINESAKTIWDILSSDTTEDEIIRIMSDKYDAPTEVLRKDINNFIEILRRENILEE